MFAVDLKTKALPYVTISFNFSCEQHATPVINLPGVYIPSQLVDSHYYKMKSFSFCSLRDKVYRVGGPATVWNRCVVEEDLWGVFRFRPQEPVLFSGNANQVLKRIRIALSWNNLLLYPLFNTHTFTLAFQVWALWSESEECIGGSRESRQLWSWILNQSIHRLKRNKWTPFSCLGPFVCFSSPHLLINTL